MSQKEMLAYYGGIAIFFVAVFLIFAKNVVVVGVVLAILGEYISFDAIFSMMKRTRPR